MWNGRPKHLTVREAEYLSEFLQSGCDAVDYEVAFAKQYGHPNMSNPDAIKRVLVVLAKASTASEAARKLKLGKSQLSHYADKAYRQAVQNMMATDQSVGYELASGFNSRKNKEHESESNDPIEREIVKLRAKIKTLKAQRVKCAK